MGWRPAHNRSSGPCWMWAFRVAVRPRQLERRGWPFAHEPFQGGSFRTMGWPFAHEGPNRDVSVRSGHKTGAMSNLAVRQRSMIPRGDRGPIEGWMDDDVASAATQLFSGGAGGGLGLVGAG